MPGHTWDCAAAGTSENCILAAVGVGGLAASDVAWGTRWVHPRSGRIPGPAVPVPRCRFAEGEAASWGLCSGPSLICWGRDLGVSEAIAAAAGPWGRRGCFDMSVDYLDCRAKFRRTRTWVCRCSSSGDWVRPSTGLGWAARAGLPGRGRWRPVEEKDQIKFAVSGLPLKTVNFVKPSCSSCLIQILLTLRL